jgi:hypothetical protein
MIADSDYSDQENEIGEVLDVEGSEVSDNMEADQVLESTTDAVPFDRTLPASHRNFDFSMQIGVCKR